MKKEKEKYHKTFMDKFINTIIFLGSLFIVALLVFIYSNTVHASGTYNGRLPYKFEYITALNNWASYNDNGNEILESIESYGLPVRDENYVLILRDFGFYANEEHGSTTFVIYRAWFSLLPITDFNSGTSNIFTQQNTFNVDNTKTSYYFGVHFDYYGGFTPITFNVNNNPSPNYTMFGHSTQSITIENTGYFVTANVPFYFEKNFYDVNDNLILYVIPESPQTTGHATPPEEFQHPVYTQGHAKPQTVPPTYTVNNYSWTTYTPPTVDNSTLEKLLESLTDIVKYNASYLKDNLHNEFSNLIDNIKGLIDFIGQTIQYYGNLIIETLQNLITTFYNNMVSIGEDITSKLTYIVSPLDTDAVTSAFQDTGIYNDYDAIFDMVHDAFGFYNDISEPTSFMIPIDLRSVTILHQRQIIYIDLGWLNSCKTIIRAFMWCVLTFGLLYTIIDSIPDYLQGNDE